MSQLYQITSKFSYQPQSGDLSWEIGMPSSMTLDMEGRLTSGKDSYDLNQIILKKSDLFHPVLAFACLKLVSPSWEPPDCASGWGTQALSSGKDSYDLNLEKAAVKVMGMELFSLGVKYYLAYTAPAGEASGPPLGL